jgi:hypothetical protein
MRWASASGAALVLLLAACGKSHQAGKTPKETVRSFEAALREADMGAVYDMLSSRARAGTSGSGAAPEEPPPPRAGSLRSPFLGSGVSPGVFVVLVIVGFSTALHSNHSWGRCLSDVGTEGLPVPMRPNVEACFTPS